MCLTSCSVLHCPFNIVVLTIDGPNRSALQFNENDALAHIMHALPLPDFSLSFWWGVSIMQGNLSAIRRLVQQRGTSLKANAYIILA